MKKFKILVFALFVCFLSISCISAEEFDCKIGDYTVTYNSSGKPVSVSDSSGKKLNLKKEIISDFEPTKESECPTNEIAKIVFEGLNSNLQIVRKEVENKEFECKIGDYTLIYDSSGSIISAKNKNGSTLPYKRFGSIFKPTKESECPTEEEAKISILNGGLTFYVANINETLGSNASKVCYEIKDPTSCKVSKDYACVWVENEKAAGDQGGYCNVDNLLYVGCGGAGDIPVQVPSLISMLVNMLKIATPIILIFISMVTLFKALVAQKEDEIKKATNSLVKKIIAGALVFFVVAIVQYIISVVAEDDYYEGFESCLDCFLNNSCETNTYYKTVVSGEEMCTFLTTGETEACSNLFGESK